MEILTVGQDDLMDELDARLKYMDKHPGENSTLQEAIYYAKHGIDLPKKQPSDADLQGESKRQAARKLRR